MKKINTLILISSLLFGLCISIGAQVNITADLEKIISTAQNGSPDALVAESRLVNSKWRNIAFKSGFKPQLRLNATLPDLNRGINQMNLPNGTVDYISQSYMSTSVGVSLYQVIKKTGGSISIGTDINRLDQFKSDLNPYNKSYLTNPVNIEIDQPLFSFNAFEWDEKANDLTFESEQKEYVEQRENIAYDAVNNFFQLYVTEISLENALRNQVYLDSLNLIAEGRYSVGRIAETEMLQVKLGSKNASAQVSQLELDLQVQTEKLRDFLGISEEVIFDLVSPSDPPMYLIDKDIAINEATKNRSLTLEFRSRLLSAERAVEEARRNAGPSISLQGSVGLTGTNPTFTDSYTGLLDRENIRLALSVPIADWGLRKAQKEIARSNLELEQLQVSLDQNNFEREISVNINQLVLKRKQLRLQKEALEVAELRLDIAKKRYQIGKTDVLDLNSAILDQRNSIRDYYSALWNVWQAHYEIRNLTLYDFVENKSITY